MNTPASSVMMAVVASTARCGVRNGFTLRCRGLRARTGAELSSMELFRESPRRRPCAEDGNQRSPAPGSGIRVTVNAFNCAVQVRGLLPFTLISPSPSPRCPPDGPHPRSPERVELLQERVVAVAGDAVSHDAAGERAQGDSPHPVAAGDMDALRLGPADQGQSDRK